jgi:hypothetical protein
MPIQVKSPAPTVIQDSLPLPPKVPVLPADIIERFPSLKKWQEEQEMWYRKLSNAIQDGNRTISQTIDTSVINALRGTIGAFTFETNSIEIGADENFIGIYAYPGGGEGAKIQLGADDASHRVRLQTDWSSLALSGLFLEDDAENLEGYFRIDENANAVRCYLGGGTAVTHALTLQGDFSRILFGEAGDTNLYWNAANELKTDDSFTVGGTAKILTLAGAGSRTVVAAADGTLSAP